MQQEREAHYEALKKENDELVSRINAIRAAQAQQEPKIAKVAIDLHLLRRAVMGLAVSQCLKFHANSVMFCAILQHFFYGAAEVHGS